MTTEPTPAPTNPLASLIARVEGDVAKLVAGPHQLVSISLSGSIVFKDGKFFLAAHEALDGIDLGEQDVELDPAVAAHFIANGVRNGVGALFGKK